MNRPASFRAVKFLPLLAIAFLTGCQTPYTKFTVTDYQGDRLATWVAEGNVTSSERGVIVFPAERLGRFITEGKLPKAEFGYRIRAVERTTGGANPVTTRYPNGWMTTVTGPNIVRERIPKPEWLRGMDGEYETVTTTTEVTVEKTGRGK